MGVTKFNRVLALFAAALLAGCETLGLDSSADVDPLLKQDEPTFLVSKSGIQACLVGAGIGALGGLLLGRDATTVAVAAAAGCGVGAGADYLLDKRRAEFANNEQRMNSYIDDINKDRNALEKYMVNVRQVVEKNRRQLAQIEQDIKTKSGDEKARAQELATMRANQAFLNKKLEDLDQRIAEYQNIAEAESTSGVTVAQMLQNLTQLERERDDLRGLVESTYTAVPAIQQAKALTYLAHA